MNTPSSPQVAFHDLVLSLDGEGGWAVYPGKRGEQEEGSPEGEDEGEALQLASSSSLGTPGAPQEPSEVGYSVV